MNNLIDRNRLRAQLAVLSILRDLGASPGNPALFGDVSHRWSDCGIREEDLASALDDLARNGLIWRRPEAPDQIVATLAGQAFLRDQPAWMEYQLLVPRAEHAAFVKQNGTRMPGPMPRRRREDAQRPARGVA